MWGSRRHQAQQTPQLSTHGPSISVQLLTQQQMNQLHPNNKHMSSCNRQQGMPHTVQHWNSSTAAGHIAQKHAHLTTPAAVAAGT
jgi:hypothetical protein